MTSPDAALRLERQIATELDVREGQVHAAVQLLDGGATVPFIARYRKELTGALDDTQLRNLESRLQYLRELANAFHTYYNAEAFIVADAPLRNARLALVLAVQQVLRNGLTLLGVSAPESM